MKCNIMSDEDYEDFINNECLGRKLEDTNYYKKNYKDNMSNIEKETLLEAGLLFYKLQQAQLKIKIAKLQLGEDDGEDS